INSETYKEIKNEYKEDTYLKNVLKVLENSGSDEAKQLGKQLKQYELNAEGLIIFKENLENF
ncbi:8618_t:CDS:1, partial [Gigaspora margarita]